MIDNGVASVQSNPISNTSINKIKLQINCLVTLLVYSKYLPIDNINSNMVS